MPKPKHEFKGKNVILDAEAKALYTAKFRTILNAGLAKGHDAIVFNAFGCGYNQAPPQAVAAIIRDLITTEFAQTYKHITFAILEDENCGKAWNLNGTPLRASARSLATHACFPSLPHRQSDAVPAGVPAHGEGRQGGLLQEVNAEVLV